MAVKLAQTIYDATNESKKDNLTIEGKNIIQLGIQGLPGTKFWLNSYTGENNNAMLIGTNGIFELDLHATNCYISKVVINISEKYDEYETKKALLIIDYLYEEE